MILRRESQIFQGSSKQLLEFGTNFKKLLEKIVENGQRQRYEQTANV